MKAHAATWAARLRLAENDGDVADVVAMIESVLDDEGSAT
jgi:hypothetical protein